VTRLGIEVFDAHAHSAPTVRTLVKQRNLLVVFPGSWQSLAEGTIRHYALPDLVTWHGPHLLTPISPADGAVKVGGVNVCPDVIRAVLLAHPGVGDVE
jgi:hypothetical protein